MTATSGDTLTPFDDRQKAFLGTHVYEGLNATQDPVVLEHFANVWWELCGWERQRAADIDTKATGLFGLASVATAVVAIGDAIPVWARLVAALLFLVSAVASLAALFVRDHGGFYDADVFGATHPGPTPGIDKQYTDESPKLMYLRELAIQRWAVYDRHKQASEKKASIVLAAQVAAVVALIWLCIVLAIVARQP